ncbi:hypothetical protein, partial [Eubacterium aggregans]|uniref:hypothetical protein n=1 Tax=Eubacterium aggregans TaxID=81409 RepID=UPI003F3749B3
MEGRKSWTWSLFASVQGGTAVIRNNQKKGIYRANAIFGRLRMMESLFEKGGNKVTAQEELKKLESDYLEQRYIRRLKIM